MGGDSERVHKEPREGKYHRDVSAEPSVSSAGGDSNVLSTSSTVAAAATPVSSTEASKSISRPNVTTSRISQPGSPHQQPYHISPYGNNPTSGPQTTNAPHFSNVALPTNVYSATSPYSTPYGNGNSNGNTTPSHLPQTPNPSLPQSPLGFPGQNMAGQPNYQSLMAPPIGAGTMGPPSKPADKGSKDDGVDPMDVLGGTGVDLREEEQYQFRSYNLQQTGSQSGFISQGHGFAQFPPGNAASFYGAGPANVNGEAPGNASQEEFEIQAAKQAFESASRNLATSRKNELSNPFLSIGRLHSLLLKSSHENGLGLNLERNPQNGNSMGHFKLPEQYDNNRVDVKTSVVPNGAFTATNGNFLPADSYLCDQIALLSLATKHRLRSLVSDAARLSKERQRSSHGVVPEEWSDAAAPNDAGNSGAVAEGAVRGGWESAVSPLSNSRKRSFSTANKIPTPISEGMKTPIEPLKFKNVVVTALRSSAQKERDFEEERIRKRNERAARASGDTSRQGSIMPGTPGSVAPEEKAPSKKEQRKKAEAKNE
ncbi:hypothetical protein B0O99DRAFT_682172 [Bisporella sp. PMI_857]|nr:hypothetical protein B0O99DRAFT_682172 [Bisporella sp. PMI_857]